MTDERTLKETTQREAGAQALGLGLPDDAQLRAELQELVHSAGLFRKAYLGLLLGEHSPDSEVPEEQVRSLQDAERCIVAWADRLEPSKVTA